MSLGRLGQWNIRHHGGEGRGVSMSLSWWEGRPVEH